MSKIDNIKSAKSTFIYLYVPLKTLSQPSLWRITLERKQYNYIPFVMKSLLLINKRRNAYNCDINQ